MSDVHCYGEISMGDSHHVVFSVPHPTRGRILKAQTFIVEGSSGSAFMLTEHIADDETAVVIGVFDDDIVEAKAEDVLEELEARTGTLFWPTR